MAAYCGGLGTAAAGAATARVVSWSITPALDAGTQPTVAFSVRVPSGDSAVLQRQKGKRWIDVAFLKGRKSVAVPALKRGTYFFRVSIQNRLGAVVASSKAQIVKVYVTPSISLTMSGAANAGAAIPYSWTASKIPAGGAVVLQEQEGTGHVWQTLATMPASTGTADLPGQSLGANYQFRAAVTTRSGAVLAAQTASLDVFGQVPLSDLVNDPGGDNSGTYTGPTSVFDYEGLNGGCALDCDGLSYQPQTLLSVQPTANDCESLSLTFIEGDYSSQWKNDAGDSVTLSVLQQAANPVGVSSPFNVAGALNVTLTPGQSWSLTIQAAGPSLPNAYVDGYGMCDSTHSVVGND
jgi:hypothetical protein